MGRGWALSGPLFPEPRQHLCCPPPARAPGTCRGRPSGRGQRMPGSTFAGKAPHVRQPTGICFIGAAHMTHRAISARTMRSHSSSAADAPAHRLPRGRGACLHRLQTAFCAQYLIPNEQSCTVPEEAGARLALTLLLWVTEGRAGTAGAPAYRPVLRQGCPRASWSLAHSLRLWFLG